MPNVERTPADERPGADFRPHLMAAVFEWVTGENWKDFLRAKLAEAIEAKDWIAVARHALELEALRDPHPPMALLPVTRDLRDLQAHMLDLTERPEPRVIAALHRAAFDPRKSGSKLASGKAKLLRARVAEGIAELLSTGDDARLRAAIDEACNWGLRDWKPDLPPPSAGAPFARADGEMILAALAAERTRRLTAAFAFARAISEAKRTLSAMPVPKTRRGGNRRGTPWSRDAVKLCDGLGILGSFADPECAEEPLRKEWAQTLEPGT